MFLYGGYMRLNEKVLHYFGDYPLDRLWYLLIDYNRREELGPLGFDTSERDTEQGYLSGMFKGLNYVFESIDTPLSLRYLETLHEKVIDKVTKVEVVSQGAQAHGKGFRKDTTPVEFGFTPTGEKQNVTEAGFIELLDHVRSGNSYFRVELNDFSRLDQKALESEQRSDQELYKVMMQMGGSVSILPKGPGVLNDRISKIIENFQVSMSNPQVTSNDDKIRAIAICIHQLELTHPFDDANCRTMSLLLNKLLIQHELGPTILENPNRIDAYSIDELVDEIKKGQTCFSNQISNGAQRNYDQGQNVIYLENNPAVSALLVYQTMASMPIKWHEVNIGDRQCAIEIMTGKVASAQTALRANDIQPIKENIQKRVLATTYEKPRWQVTPMRGLFYRDVMEKVVSGRPAEAIQSFRSGNRFGVREQQLRDDGQDMTFKH